MSFNMGEKKLVKVNILMDKGILMTKKDPPCVACRADENKKTYSGLSWDVWKAIEPKLKKKYNFKLTFTPEKEWRPNHNLTVENVQKGKYDMVVGVYMHTIARNKAINFTQPVAIDGPAIIHAAENVMYERFVATIYPFLKAGFMLILVGMFIGVILFFIDPSRTLHLPQLQKKQKKRRILAFFRSILTGISSMFGEMGYLSENASLSIVKIIAIVVIMAMATFFVNFVQAEVTALNIESREAKGINKYNIVNYNPYLGFKNAAPVTQLEKLGAKVKYLPKMSTSDAIKKYKKEKMKYGGYITTIALGLEYVNRDKSLELAFGDFGFEPISFIVTKKKPDLLKDIDHEILKLRESLRLTKICRTYFPESWGSHHICALE